jgi:hypothetical protein
MKNHSLSVPWQVPQPAAGRRPGAARRACRRTRTAAGPVPGPTRIRAAGGPAHKVASMSVTVDDRMAIIDYNTSPLFLPAPHCLFLSFSFSLSLSSLCLCLLLSVSASLSLPLCLFLSPSLSLCLCLSVSASLSLPLERCRHRKDGPGTKGPPISCKSR